VVCVTITSSFLTFKSLLDVFLNNSFTITSILRPPPRYRRSVEVGVDSASSNSETPGHGFVEEPSELLSISILEAAVTVLLFSAAFVNPIANKDWVAAPFFLGLLLQALRWECQWVRSKGSLTERFTASRVANSMNVIQWIEFGVWIIGQDSISPLVQDVLLYLKHPFMQTFPHCKTRFGRFAGPHTSFLRLAPTLLLFLFLLLLFAKLIICFIRLQIIGLSFSLRATFPCAFHFWA